MGAEKINPKIANKTVLVLTDFFLPLRDLMPTIENLAKNKNKVIVVSFFGEQSLTDRASKLAETLGRKFIDLAENASRLPEYDIPHLYFAPDGKFLSGMRSGDIAVVENLNLIGKDAVNQLPEVAETFVNDNFSAEDKQLKSLAKNLPAAHGLLFVRTKKKLEGFQSRSKKPLVLVLGGVKLAGKEELLDQLMARADTVLVGGGAANLFFKLSGFGIGQSHYDSEADTKMLKKFMRDYQSKIKLPRDVVVAAGPAGPAACVQPEKVLANQMILDIGPQTILEFSKFLKQGQTLIWCGALGRVEETSFRHGTGALLRLFASRPSLGSTVAAASGETVFDYLEAQGFLESLDLAMPQTLGLLRALVK